MESVEFKAITGFTILVSTLAIWWYLFLKDLMTPELGLSMFFIGLGGILFLIFGLDYMDNRIYEWKRNRRFGSR